MGRLLASLFCCLCLSAQMIQESFQRDPGPLDFIHGEGLEQFILQSLTGDALVGVDAAGRVVPRLATRWTVQKGRIRFMLRGDARFADGAPVTVEDALWTIQAIQSDAGASPTKRSALEGVTARAMGPELELRSNKPAERLLKELAGLPIARRGHAGMGSGPFRLERSGAEWTLRARTHFLNPRISGLHFRLVGDEQAMLQNLQKGWLTLGVPPARRELKPPAGYLELHQPTHAQVMIWSRVGSELLRHLEVWRGEAYPPGAMGSRIVPSRGHWPETLGFAPRRMAGPRPDARGKRWEILYPAGDETVQRLLQFIRERARREGAELDLHPVESALLFDRLAKGSFQLACALNVFEPHPWSVLDLLLPEGSVNFARWSHPRLAALLNRLDAPGTPAWVELQDLWAGNPTALPIADFTSIVWVDRRLKVQPSPLGLYLATPGAAGWRWEP